MTAAQSTGRRPRIAFAAILVQMGIANAADLTPLPLEKLLDMRVVAASSYEQLVAEAPSAVSVITAQDIRVHGYRTLADALASLPGLYVTADQTWRYLGSRGFNRIGDYNSRFQLSVNGLRTNDAVYDMAYLGTEFPLDMELIERIEFAPGPGSSIYGSNAMLGVINVITRSTSELEGPRVATAAGSNNQRELAVSFGKRFESGLDVLASVSGLRGEGEDYYFREFDFASTGGGVAAGANGERYKRGYLQASYGNFDLEVLGGRREKDSPSIYFSSDFLRRDRNVDSLGFATLRYRRMIAQATTVEARVNAGRYDFTGIYAATGALDSRDDATGRWRGAELRVVSTYWDSHKVVAGAEVQQDYRLDQRNADAEVTYLDRHDSGRRVAGYIQDEIRLDGRWLINAGLRHDHYYSAGSSTSPRLALIGGVAPATTVKLLYGQAFRAPNAYELYYQSDTFVSNATLGAEHMRSTEAVLEQQLGETLHWRASIFHYRFADLIEQVEEGGEFVFRNVDSVRARGVEVAANVLLPAGVHARASASFVDACGPDGLRLTNSPRYTATASVDAPLFGSGIRGALGMSAVGPRLDRDRGEIPAVLLTNLVFTTQRPWHGASLSLGIYNLFDRDNRSPVGEFFAPAQVPGAGRSVRLAMEWRH